MPDGTRVKVGVRDILEDDVFVLDPLEGIDIPQGSIVKVTDGQDSVLAKVMDNTSRGLRLCMECYLSPGHERRSDVAIYDRVYYGVEFVCHEKDASRRMPEALHRIQAQRTVIDSFVRGRYGRGTMPEHTGRRNAYLEQHLWEIDRKLDLLIHMMLSADFKVLIKTSPREVNISASGMRFITESPCEVGDILEISVILPMRPLLMVRFLAEVLRLKPLTSSPSVGRWAVAVKFHRVDEDTREDIIRYLFRRQREVLRRRQA
jgi:hypothetical protein